MEKMTRSQIKAQMLSIADLLANLRAMEKTMTDEAFQAAWTVSKDQAHANVVTLLRDLTTAL
ncbi:MAG TPA: hypothetical protein VLM89_07810 [Phycisphaerae bacterium]|nr:hypothetical protein [Phycisphaerae bacterium]